ncbi:hypothetical protein RD792_013878 [Penstemon davidsonii]|uniref:Uncharacterized protein n=1 Tax=Penstemon davidsonii TaxID=160366 RepID=A0ABR0CNP5_9LAMI|nr:hypothetical protein RD792_013878 [Penstemon davidsonii]
MDNLQCVVISPQFCVSNQVKLSVVKKPIAVTDGNFVVTDDKGNIKLKVEEKLLSIHGRHILLDFDENNPPIVTIKKKILSAHKRWQVFKGDSADLLFSAKKSSIIQFRTELDVFSASNHEESCWDFKVIGSWFERSCVIYNKDSAPIAHMHKKHTIGSTLLGKDTFDVNVYPNVDYAFIVALVVILYEINQDKDD